MPLYKVRYSTKGIVDEMILELHNDDVIVATNTLRLYYKVDNPILLSISQQYPNLADNKQVKNNFEYNIQATKTDPYAIITFCTGLLGFMILPIVFVPICYIFSLLSHYRLKENKNFKGKGLRLAGALFNTVNIIYLIYQFRSGVFDIYSF